MNEVFVENSINSMDWDFVLHKAIQACRLGREVLLRYYGNLEHIEEKFQAGLVSEADRESERVIKEFLGKAFPEIEFLGEEGAYLEGQKNHQASSGMRWIVDPLDGTTNYIHRFPIWCISLGLEVQGQMQLAVIDVPVLGEVFTAIKGRGAFLNGRKLKVSTCQELSKAYLATGFVAEHEHVISEQLRVFDELVRNVRGVRRPGAAAYDLALVAKGVFDGYWERNIQPWDAAAGILLVQEAGGLCQTYRGETYTPFKNSIVAGSAAVVSQLQTVLAKHIDKKTE